VLRERVALRRAAVEARLYPNGHPHGPKRRARRRRLLLLLLLLLLYLLLRQCHPDETAAVAIPHLTEPERAVLELPAVSAERSKKSPPSAVPRFKGRIKSRERATYSAEPPSPPTWISDLRLQVAARSPRLARCFEGTERPGALRWTASVDLARGVVSDHELEPTLGGAELTAPLRACLIGVLSAPTYRLPRPLPDPDANTQPPRISIVIEF